EESATGRSWEGPECGPGLDFAESYGPTLDYRDWYNPGLGGECRDVSLRLDSEFDCGEDPSMEVEEVLYGHSPSVSNTASADYHSDEPLVPKVPLKASCRAHHSEASKLPHVMFRETSPSSEETPSTRAHSLGTHATVPKLHSSKKEAIPVPTPERGKVAGMPPKMGAQKSLPHKSARGDPPQEGWTSAQLVVCASHFVPLSVSAFICQCFCPCVCCHPGPCPCPLCPAHAGPCQVTWSSGFRNIG
ncbi:hypothetical protein P4O66_005922, partial [Electrophorus voltai]